MNPHTRKLLLSEAEAQDELARRYSSFWSQAPGALLAQVNRAISDEEKLPAGIGFLTVAEFALNGTGFSNAEHLAWSQLAVTSYEHLAEVEPSLRETYLRRTMMIRAHMIMHHGQAEGDPLRALGTILNWADDGLNIPIEEAASSIQRWGTLDRKSKEQLITMMDIVGTLKTLINADVLHPDVVLSQWLELEEEYGRIWNPRVSA